MSKCPYRKHHSDDFEEYCGLASLGKVYCDGCKCETEKLVDIINKSKTNINNSLSTSTLLFLKTLSEIFDTQEI